MAVERHAGHRALVRDRIDDDAQLRAASLDRAASAHGFGVELTGLTQERAQAALRLDGGGGAGGEDAGGVGHRDEARAKGFGGSGGQCVIVDDDFAGERAICGVRDGGGARDGEAGIVADEWRRPDRGRAGEVEGFGRGGGKSPVLRGRGCGGCGGGGRRGG